ncbi:MAG: glycosyltransferase family 39 protein, partial [Cyclobacteriaceae bacterium]
FGSNFFTAIGLRYLLIFGIFLTVYKLGEMHYKHKLFAFLASASLLLFLQFSVESLRQTHTLLVTFSVGLLVFTISKLIKRPTIFNYFLLGLVLAIGVLSKYNFVVFALAILIAGLFIDTYRKYILTPKAAISIAVLLLLTSPNLYWLYQHMSAIQSETMAELQGSGQKTYLPAIASGFSEILVRILSFSLFFLIAALILIEGRLKEFWSKPKSEFVLLIGGAIGISMAILIVIIALFKVTVMHERWLQPLLFLLTFYFFGAIDSASDYSLSRFKRYAIVLQFTFAIILVYTTIDLTLGHKERRITRPYDRFAAYLLSERNIGSKDIDMVAANTLDLAGNMKFHLSDFDMELLKPNCSDASDISFIQHSKKILLIWDDQDISNLLECLETRKGGETNIIEENTISFNYHYSKDLSHSFSYAIVQFL